MKPTCRTVGGNSAEIRRLWIVLIAGIAIALFEFAGGIYSHSLALASDAGHVLADNASTGLALFIAYRAAKASPERRLTLRRRGAMTLSISLGVMGLLIIIAALCRLADKQHILAPIMVSVSLFGAGCNYIQHLTLHGADESEKHSMHRLLHQHILSDLFQSLAVVLSGIVIWITGFTLCDPLLSIMIGLLMIRWMVKGLRAKNLATHDEACGCVPDNIVPFKLD